QPGTVGADEPARRAPEECLDANHVGDGHAFSDADDERHAGIGRLHDRVGRGRGRHEDQRAVGARGLDTVFHRVPDGKSLVGGSALPRRDASHYLGSVLLAARGVEGALLAGYALHQDARLLVDEDAHARAPRASATAFFAPSSMSSAITRASPDSASIFFPCSTLVPSARRTTG